MKKDWALTLTGPLAIHNLFYVTLFDKALSKIPKQKKGLFLFENLGWESAFIHAWRKSGHGVLVAVAHATVRYWDTRYFFDPRAILSKDTNKLPHADMVALNGKFAVDSLLRSGYPKERIIECEALRYLHFSNAQFKQKKIRQQGEPLRILILGDYMPSGTINMLVMLEQSIPGIAADVLFTIKSHPNYPVQPEEYPLLHLTIITDQLHTILQDFDMALSSNMTSASVDACLAGLPVIIVLEDAELNFSPLRGNANVNFVSNADELAHAVNRDGSHFSVEGIDDFFYLDPTLSRWEKILAS
jgi:surface carbohydrate biosynthesis protein (TIGR04326 family)